MDYLVSISKCGIESLEANAFINAKVEEKRLKFNEGKCRQLHIGKSTDDENKCLEINVHDKILLKDHKERYLGDIISCDGKNDENIKAKVSSGIGASNTVMNILNEICLGSKYFEMAIHLRETVFNSTILLNAET